MSLASDIIQPPTQSLPPIKSLRLGTVDLDVIQAAIDHLRFLYNPQVRGSSRRQTNTAIQVRNGDKNSSLNTIHDPKNTDVDPIRSDPFERNYAIRWLTTFISSASTRNGDAHTEHHQLDELLQGAASLLAACSGAAASGRITRTFTFGPSSTGETVQIPLNDAPLENQEYSSVGAQTWGGACVLAEMIVEDPCAFGIPEQSNETDFRVLELGAGTGLVGLSLYKLLAARKIKSSLVLTDYYPSVLENLRGNVQQNLLPDIPAHVARLDWEIFPTMDVADLDDQLKGEFDLIVGADIIYEGNHAKWIKACLGRLLRHPSKNAPGAIFHLVIPLRATHTMESSTIEKVFSPRLGTLYENAAEQLVILHHERIVCDAHATTCDTRFPDRADEVIYAYYKIGWADNNNPVDL